MIDQTIAELELLGIDPTITFGTIGDIVFATATAQTIRLNRSTAGGDFTIRRMAITPIGSYRTYTVRLTGSDVLPNFGNYRWSEALGDIPTRVVFNLSHVTGIE